MANEALIDQITETLVTERQTHLVKYYMKGEPRAVVTFASFKAAQTFAKGIRVSASCECCTIERIRH